jgi:hypothetical protein
MTLDVGSLVRLTLVSGVVVEGAVFSFEENTGMMVLMEVPRAKEGNVSQAFVNPNVHVVNGLFVQKVEPLPDDGRLLLLPRNALGDTLPPAENGDVKKLQAKFKAEHKKRTGIYHESASIDACDTFEFFHKIYPDLKWSNEPQHLDVATKAAGCEVKLVLTINNGSILLSGNGDQAGHSWRHPKVIKASDGVADDIVGRLVKQAQACAARP